MCILSRTYIASGLRLMPVEDGCTACLEITCRGFQKLIECNRSAPYIPTNADDLNGDTITNNYVYD